MEFRLNNIKLNSDETRMAIISYIKKYVIDNEPSIENLGNYLNKLGKESNISISKNGKKRKINTYIKEYYNGLQCFIEDSQLFQLTNDKRVLISQEEDFILV
jgi:hypothetical protein